MHVPDNRSRLATQAGLIVRHPNGSTEGHDPRELSRDQLGAAGHIAAPLLKVLRGQVSRLQGRRPVGSGQMHGHRLRSLALQNGNEPVRQAAGAKPARRFKNTPEIEGVPAGKRHPRAVEPSAPAEIGG
jgi:hypothetical protein